MARPIKQGLDYFPLDVHTDDQIELLALDKGAIAEFVVITLWRLIYKKKGYYVEAGQDLPLLVKKRVAIETDTIRGIINASIERGIFNRELYDNYNILTSKGVQERYFVAVSKKKNIDLIKEYLLVDTYGIKNATITNVNSELYTPPKTKQQIVKDELMVVNSELMPVKDELMIAKDEFVGINSDHSGINATNQTKGNKTKEDKTKEDKTIKRKTIKRKTNSPKKGEVVDRDLKRMELSLPVWLSQELWGTFVKHRKEIKSKMSSQAERLNLNKLIQFHASGYDHEDIINTTIANGWKGFFKPKKVNYPFGVDPDPKVAAGIYTAKTARTIRNLKNWRPKE